MITKNEIKIIRSLARKRNRKDLNTFVVEGAKMVQEAIDSDFIVKTVFYTGEQAVPQAEGVRFEQISDKEMNQVSHLTTPSNILALMRYPEYEPDFSIIANERVLVLDAIRDPGNLGTIIRSADWFGIRHILASGDTVDCFNPKVTQATMGSLFRIKVHYMNLDVLDDIRKKNKDFKVFAAMLEGDEPNALQTSGKSGALIIGNEGRGVSDEAMKWVDQSVTIKRIGEAESLNAAISTSILLYEWAKN